MVQFWLRLFKTESGQPATGQRKRAAVGAAWEDDAAELGVAVGSCCGGVALAVEG